MEQKMYASGEGTDPSNEAVCSPPIQSKPQKELSKERNTDSVGNAPKAGPKIHACTSTSISADFHNCCRSSLKRPELITFALAHLQRLIKLPGGLAMEAYLNMLFKYKIFRSMHAEFGGQQEPLRRILTKKLQLQELNAKSLPRPRICELGGMLYEPCDEGSRRLSLLEMDEAEKSHLDALNDRGKEMAGQLAAMAAPTCAECLAVLTSTIEDVESRWRLIVSLSGPSTKQNADLNLAASLGIMRSGITAREKRDKEKNPESKLGRLHYLLEELAHQISFRLLPPSEAYLRSTSPPPFPGLPPIHAPIFRLQMLVEHPVTTNTLLFFITNGAASWASTIEHMEDKRPAGTLAGRGPYFWVPANTGLSFKSARKQYAKEIKGEPEWRGLVRAARAIDQRERYWAETPVVVVWRESTLAAWEEMKARGKLEERRMAKGKGMGRDKDKGKRLEKVELVEEKGERMEMEAEETVCSETRAGELGDDVGHAVPESTQT